MTDIYIEVGESPEALRARYGKLIDANEKNAAAYGVTFYSMDWEPPDLKEVSIRNGKSSVQIEHVLGVMGTYDSSQAQEGLSGYKLSLGLSITETMPHDEARQKFYEMLGRIQKAGWEWLIYQSQPRLSGAQMLHYYLDASPGLGSMDPNFTPPLNDWMKLENQSSWRFYLNGVYMEVRLSRDSKKMDVNLPGVYLINISLESHDSKWRTLFPEADRARWRELLPAEIEDELRARAETEEELKAQGYTILTDYQNPDQDAGAAQPSPRPKPVSPAQPAVSEPASLKARLGRWLKGE